MNIKTCFCYFYQPISHHNSIFQPIKRCSSILQPTVSIKPFKLINKPIFQPRFTTTLPSLKRFISISVNTRKPRTKKHVVADETTNSKICSAYSTGELYDIHRLRKYFEANTDKYSLGLLPKDATDVLYVVKSDGEKTGDIFIFRHLGAFVCWNLHEDEISSLRDIIKKHEFSPYPSSVIDLEKEQISYFMVDDHTCLADYDIYLNKKVDEETQSLEKLAFSNAMALSVKLAMWESSLGIFSDSLRHIPEMMKRGHNVNITRKEVMRKMGEMLVLRHRINLYSDLLNTPDFYWDREDLEQLYTITCVYLEISKRTQVMNDKLDSCSELVELLRSHLNERHGHRLEWLIILLITAEVVFELIHLDEKYGFIGFIQNNIGNWV